MKYCRKCGAEVEDDDIYCGYCGSKLEGDIPQEESSRQDFQEESLGAKDFSNDFDKEVEREFESGNGISNGDNYVPVSSSTDNDGGKGHKQLLFNKDAKDANTYGILALIFGILGGILGIVFGILGLIKAKKALALCNTGEYDGKPKASNGRILSIIGIVLGALSLIYYIL